MPQTHYNLEPPIAVPGMRFSPAPSDVIESRPALVACPFGVAVEIALVNGIEYVQPLQDTGTTTTFLPKLYGAVIFDPAREQALATPGVNPGGISGVAQYAAGETVPVLRSGCMYVLTDSATEQASWANPWPSLGAVNVWHSSTGANFQGVFTQLAPSATVGAEIDALPTSIIGRDPSRQQTYTNGWGSAFSVAIAEFNLPGTT
jgi:hypothetical protein